MNRPEPSLDRGRLLKGRGYGRASVLDTLRFALGPLLVTIVLGSCVGSEGLPTDPGGRPRFDESGAPALAGSLSPTANNQAVGPITLGSYTYPTLAVIQVSGLLDRYYGPTSYWGQSAGTLIGQWDAAGGWTESDGCTGNVWVLAASGGTIFCDAGNHKNPTSVWADTQVVQGTVTAQWHAGPPAWGVTGCGPGGQPPCFTYTGSHAVAVTPVSASLRVKASRYVTTPAAPSVTFTAAVSPTQVGGRNVPFSVQSWTWVADTGSGSGPACGTNNICSFSPSSSGTMRVDAIVNGVTRNKSVHIRVLCKSTDDKLLDSLPILDAMAAAMTASGDPNLPGGQGARREHQFSVQCDTLNECSSPPPVDLGNPCGGVPPRVDTVPGIKVDGHTHPFNPVVPNPNAPGGWILTNPASDSLPDTCKTSPGTKGSGPRPSDADMARVESVNNFPGAPNLPHYVVDPDNIFAIPGGNMTREQRWSATKTIPRKQGNCRIL